MKRIAFPLSRLSKTGQTYERKENLLISVVIRCLKQIKSTARTERILLRSLPASTVRLTLPNDSAGSTARVIKARVVF